MVKLEEMDWRNVLETAQNSHRQSQISLMINDFIISLAERKIKELEKKRNK